MGFTGSVVTGSEVVSVDLVVVVLSPPRPTTPVGSVIVDGVRAVEVGVLLVILLAGD